jgi:hypothetical protein
MRDIVRLLVAPLYLLGWLAHVYLGLCNPEIYRLFGQTALIPAFADFWYGTVMPHITAFALLLAAFEVMVGILLVSKGMWVKVGLVLSIAFGLFLIQLGLAYPVSDGFSDFLMNRLPNLLFIVLQTPLLWGQDKRSLPEAIQGWFGRLRRT